MIYIWIYININTSPQSMQSNHKSHYSMLLETVRVSIFLLLSLVDAQSIEGLGVNGGKGHSGGIGDKNNPVTKAQEFITDNQLTKGSRKLSKGPGPYVVNSSSVVATDDVWIITVDGTESGKRQEMVGFGHAWTDSTVINFNKLEDEIFDKLMDELFGENGNNMGLMRHTIGSSDLSYDQYSYDDNGPDFNNGNPDPELSNFDLGNHGKAMAKMIARMGDYKSDITVFGSPWSAPGWMKKNELFIAPDYNSYNPGVAYNWGNNSLAVKYHAQFAEYLAKYIDAFAEYGAKINAITPENEPLNSQGGYPCMYIGAADEASLIEHHLGDKMKSRNVNIWAYDHNTDMQWYPERVMETASEYTQAAAWHCYQSPVANYTVMSEFHENYPDKMQFMTECSPGKSGFGVASNFMQPITHYANGATLWVMATDEDHGPHSPYGGCSSCMGSIIVHNSTSYSKTLHYYMLGHFSRFVRRGAYNYKVTAGNFGTDALDKQFYVNAFQNPDGSWVVIMMNNLQEDKHVELNIQGGSLAYTGNIPDQTLVTWVLPPASGESETGHPAVTGTLAQQNSVNASISIAPDKPHTKASEIPIPQRTIQ